MVNTQTKMGCEFGFIRREQCRMRVEDSAVSAGAGWFETRYHLKSLVDPSDQIRPSENWLAETGTGLTKKVYERIWEGVTLNKS